MTALAMTVLLGAAALAIDLGHLLNVRTESQRVADLAALAGAGAFVSAPGGNVTQTARAWAIQFAAQNEVDQTAVTLLPADVEVNVPESRVDVTVYHSAARGNAISTIFARVLGIQSVDVVTQAAAQAFPTGGTTCVLPLFLPDKWLELGGDPNLYDPGTDYYEPYDPANPTTTYTGYDQGDVGTSIIIKPAQGQQGVGQPNPSWYYPFDAANIPGGSNYRDAIQGCSDPTFVYSIGQLLWIEPGAMIGPTKQGFQDLINQDPNAAWDQGLDCVMDASHVGSGNPAHCRASPRLRPAPMFDPGTAPANGKKQVAISNFAGLFVDHIQGNNVHAIFAGYSGVGSGGQPSGGFTPTVLQTPRLVK